mgnify:CR=1 FL=1
MNKDLLKLTPAAIWKHFHQLTQIPRPSKHEDAIQAYIYQFGKDLGLETEKDAVGNIIIRKPATPGMENRQGVVLQGHLDMVPQKNSDKVHDFTKDPIEAYIDGEWVKANGTTLGADNGMGVAAAMAVLEATDLVHGPVEALFTSDEETGMTGANNLQPNWLKGDILINMDSEDEGELYVGCAGGEDANILFTFENEAIPEGYEAFQLSITGLKGGHSGMDIILGRGNANKLFFRFMKDAYLDFDVRLASVQGGSLRNAIPREAFGTILVTTEYVNDLKNFLQKFTQTVQSELAETEPDLKISLTPTDMPESLMDENTQINLTDAIMACPDGVIRMSDSMPGLVETSTNLAIVRSEDNNIYVSCLMRSSVDSAKTYLASRIESLFNLAGANVDLAGAYPGWKPNMNSPILKVMQDVYNQRFGKVPEIKAIHAGLECGILGAAYPNWDMISFGPTIRFPHSPDEKVHIGSVEKFWEFLVETLKNVPAKA